MRPGTARAVALLAALVMLSAVVLPAAAGQFFRGGPTDPRVVVADELQVRVFGRATVGTIEQLIAEGPASLPEAFPSTAEAVTCVSDSAADAAAGAGARSLVFECMETTGGVWAYTSVPVALDGLTPTTPTAESCIRVRGAVVDEVGTYLGASVGTVTCTGAVSGDTKFAIAPGLGSSSLGFYTVPDGYRFRIASELIVVEGGGKPTTVSLYSHRNDPAKMHPRQLQRDWPALEGPYGIPYTHQTFKEYRPRTDLYATAAANSSTSSIVFELEGFLIPLPTPTL